MKKMQIVNGDNRFELQFSSNNIEIIKPQKIDIVPEKEVISSSLKNPLDSPSFRKFLSDKKNVLIIVNDGARNTPTAKIIAGINESIKTKNVTFIVAVGTHREPTKTEYYQIFGEFYQEYKERNICHNSRKDEMLDLGMTSRGTPVKINAVISQADGVIVISSVEPHYFAGFTGGRKSFLPGIAAFETIEKNHSLALEAEAKTLQLNGNPVHEDMKEAAEMIKVDAFCILTVLDSEEKIFYAASGNMHSALEAASQKVKEVFSPVISDKADIVLAIVQPPLNRNLYQAQKGLENCRSLIKENGIFLLAADCEEGIGNSTFYELMSSAQSPDEVFQIVKENYKLGYHKAAKFVSFMQEHKLWLVSKLDDQILENIFIRNFSDLQMAIDLAAKKTRAKGRIVIVTDAGKTVPRILKQ